MLILLFFFYVKWRNLRTANIFLIQKKVSLTKDTLFYNKTIADCPDRCGRLNLVVVYLKRTLKTKKTHILSTANQNNSFSNDEENWYWP